MLSRARCFRCISGRASITDDVFYTQRTLSSCDSFVNSITSRDCWEMCSLKNSRTGRERERGSRVFLFFSLSHKVSMPSQRPVLTINRRTNKIEREKIRRKCNRRVKKGARAQERRGQIDEFIYFDDGRVVVRPHDAITQTLIHPRGRNRKKARGNRTLKFRPTVLGRSARVRSKTVCERNNNNNNNNEKEKNICPGS